MRILFLLLASLSCQAEYSFFVAGHAYGHPTTRRANPDVLGLYPPFMNRVRGNDFGVLTGDIVYQSNQREWDATNKDINSLGIPVYIAPGNHDKVGSYFDDMYLNYFAFEVEEDLFIVLDPNLDEWSISGDQLSFLREVIGDYRNTFVFFHQVLWSDRVKTPVNSLAGQGDHNFWSEVFPLFREGTYLFAGDTGVQEHHMPMITEYQDVHLIASGMGGGVNDNYIEVTVNNGVQLDTIWLQDSEIVKRPRRWIRLSGLPLNK